MVLDGDVGADKFLSTFMFSVENEVDGCGDEGCEYDFVVEIFDDTSSCFICANFLSKACIFESVLKTALVKYKYVSLNY